MVDAATRRPQQNKNLIRTEARSWLGLDPTQPTFYDVGYQWIALAKEID